MSMSVGGATVAVIQSLQDGMTCDAYRSKLAAVLKMLDCGDFGGGASYGCDEHKAALTAVERQIAATRDRIAERELRESGRAAWTAAAATRYVEAGGLSPADAASAASSLYSMIVHFTHDEVPEPFAAADEDMATWTD